MLITNILTLAALTISAVATRPFGDDDNNHIPTGTNTASRGHSQRPVVYPAQFASSSANKGSNGGISIGIDDEPSLSDAHALSRRGVGAYWCTGNEWSGKCTWSAADNSCHSWTTGPTGSFGPDAQASCTLYSQSGCEGGSRSIRWPGLRNVGYDITVGSKGEVDFPESWRCHT